jgi:hypothetical protein
MAFDEEAPGLRGGRTTARAAAIALAASIVAMTGGLGFVDGTGLFAPENWVDAGAVPTFAASPAWATVTYLPLLAAGSAGMLHLLVRAAQPRVRARWVLGAAWSSVVLAAAIAKFIYSLLLLAVAGPHGLHPLPTMGAIAAECGLTGAKYAFIGVFAAGPAALAFVIARRAGHSGSARDVDQQAEVRQKADSAGDGRGWSLVWSVPAVLLATAAADSVFPWIAGAGHAEILTIFGLVGSWLTQRMLWPRVARGLREPGGRALWCARCAVTTAGSGLGFLLPFALDGLVSGFGGTLYPVVGALMHVAVGITAGACSCAFGSVWSVVGERTGAAGVVRRVRSARGSRTAVPAVALAIVLGAELLPGAVAASAASYPVPAVASSDGGGLLPLTVLRQHGESPIIGDSAGRQVLLRGVNVNQLVDYGQPDAAKPTVRPLTDADYAQMASVYGFDVQRLNLSWSELEPRRGVFDQAYLARVRTAVDEAAQHGIYTVLDMHQDTYSKYVTAAPGTSCRLGASPEFGNDGAPAWATLTDGAKGCGFLGRDLSPNVEQAFSNLYDDTGGIGAELAATWGVLAHAFAGDTAVAGYDLLNEPGPGNAPGVTSSLLLGRLYQQLIAAIRAGESSAPDGFHHLVFFEPSILWSGLGFDVTPPVGFAADPDLVFSPHLYSQSITMDQGLGVTLTTIEQGFTLAERTAAAYGVALWSGEWGWFGSAAAVGDPFDRFLNKQNTDILGSAIWVWKKACGDPQSSASDTVEGGINLYSCATGLDVPSPAFQTTALDQAYPRSAPGRIRTLSSSPTGIDLRLSGSGTGELDVWIPGTQRPASTESGLTGLTLTAQPSGGWRLTAHADGAYALAVN